jgi:valyl-tRNA synthetase
MLDKTYQPSSVESRIYRQWLDSGAFRCGRKTADGKPADPYCIVIPPPNVTGSLHMGHALNNTLQDVLVRFERMRGKDVLWQPGTDHAGIATQSVVERQLAQRQEPDRRTMGREAFLKRVWEWKAESGGTIIGQLKRLGASCDWERERFTMDEGLSKAVLKVFVELHRQGLIYKDKRLVNWDPKLLTAISDLEVQPTETQGHLWYFKYPIKNPGRLKQKFITVATTRPETMLGDTAVAVNPEDKRWKPYIGKMVELPLTGREIPIIADDYADPEQGSGAVKITPAHDFNDFEVGRRNNLPMINIFDAHACLNENVPEVYRGMERFEARKRIVADLDALGLVEKIEPHLNKVPYGDRSGVVIEPWLTDQWYVDAKTLAKEAVAAVEDGRTKFVPANWSKTYFEWMRNIQPWCISRQIWWGHQIPAWYGPGGEIFVAHDDEEACALALRHYQTHPHPDGKPYYPNLKAVEVQDIVVLSHSFHEREKIVGLSIRRDPDVLDTWFSSALWPFSTLGWPDETPEVKHYYPTAALVTGFDIIFFWVARMMMMGMHFMKEIPFHTVYIHALVRDEKGHKMSKSKGNVMDPLDIIDGCDLDTLIQKRISGLKPDDRKRITQDTKKAYPQGIAAYGADALRFTMAALAAQGRDVKLAIPVVEGYRNFATKLWNAARFGEMNACVPKNGFDPKKAKETINCWIAGEVERAAAAVTAGIEEYRFNEAAGAIYQFVWNTFCDWYLELAKPILSGPDGAAKQETQAMFAWTYDQILKLLHPFMPFITEELWARIGEAAGGRDTMLVLAEWPKLQGHVDEAADAEVAWIIRLVTEIRSVRSEMNVPPGAQVPLVICGAPKGVKTWAERHGDLAARLARLASIAFEKSPPKGSVQIVTKDGVLALPLAGIIDLNAEVERLKREIERVNGEIAKLDEKLADERFTAKAPEHVVEENRERRTTAAAVAKRLTEALKRLEAAA